MLNGLPKFCINLLQNESIGVVDPLLWSLQDRILTFPSPMMR